ncbi:MAG: Ig-like domain-containing protein, partial [Eubacteriales bacterium]
ALTNTGDGEVSYASSDETVATVDAASGRVKVNAAGEATITATAADGATSSYAQKTASFRLTVRKADNPGYAAGSDQVAKGGNKVSLVDHVKKAEGRLTWSISGEALGCTVDENGTFTSGDETGEVTVTVTMSGNDNYIQKTIELKVSVVEGKTTRRFASSFSRTYGDPLDLPISIPIPESATPEIKYTGTLRGGDPYAESDQAPTETGDYTATVTYEDEQYNWIETLTFNILPRQLGKPEVRLGDALTYNSSEQTQQVAAVIWNGDVVPAAEYTVTDNTGTDAGTYTLTITAKDTGNYTGSVTHEFTIGKADPGYTVPEGLTATYGQTLAEVTLPAGWTWADSTQSVGNVVSPAATFKANFTGNDNYNAASNVDVTVTVGKADPTAPTGLTATYGQTLANVTLPDGWTWADSTQSVGNVVDPAATFKANFTGNDNYNAASNVDVTVTVGKADPTAPTGLTATYGQTLANVTLPDGWTWADSTQSVGDVVDPAATFKANFAGDDNHNAASNVDVTVTVSKADPTTPIGLTATYGQTLANVTLPYGWTWADSTPSVGNVVDPAATFKANYAGDDNHNAASNVNVTVTVSAADPTTPTNLTATYGQTLA